MQRGVPCQNLTGKCSSVHQQLIRWSKAGMWKMIFNTFAADSGMEWIMIDSTMIRAHQHAAGVTKSKVNGRQEQALKRSVSGFRTKTPRFMGCFRQPHQIHSIA
ncbi:hypothetical protein HCUR_00750 [Holospora curviuscula]|uniref:Transposase n=1 Tax=Holospora curviuscula TaxID=1082868 RepID=A0A2S5R9C8_9PROT|nr:hypothetical protein HCUR_00750 [Holospora curviuscula]